MRGPEDIGYRAVADWGGKPDVLSEYAVGDVVWIPHRCSAILDGRVEGPGLYRVVSVFSISEDASYYYRVARSRLVQGRVKSKLELVTEWDAGVSGRIHVIPGNVDFTAGWVLLYTPPGAAEADGT